MYRHLSRPRDGWRKTVESQGLVWPTTVLEDRSEIPYWDETAWYELSEAEVEEIEVVTERLHEMCVESVRHVLAQGPSGMDRYGLPRKVYDYVKLTFDRQSPSIYGRFDLRYGVPGEPAKLLEYNGDTPTGLVESSVIQWYWLEDVMPNSDQFNSIHERLVATWQKIGRSEVHFAHFGGEDSGEEWMTVAYLRDTAIEAKVITHGVEVEGIGWNSMGRHFTGFDERPMFTCFKLYPWENMFSDQFGDAIIDNPNACMWIEPAWKVLLSNKAMLATLWELYPDHPNLLPAYLDGPRDLDAYVKKPLHGREGDSITISSPDLSTSMPGRYGSEGFVWQQYAPLARFEGNHLVVGSWVIDGKSAGVLFRESDNPITDFYSRVLPHAVSAPRPDAETQQAWLAE